MKRLDPETRSERFLEMEASGFLDLEPEERAELLKPQPKQPLKIASAPAKPKKRGFPAKPWVQPDCRECGLTLDVPVGSRKTLCPECLTATYRAMVQRKANGDLKRETALS